MSRPSPNTARRPASRALDLTAPARVRVAIPHSMGFGMGGFFMMPLICFVVYSTCMSWCTRAFSYCPLKNAGSHRGSCLAGCLPVIAGSGIALGLMLGIGVPSLDAWKESTCVVTSVTRYNSGPM